jgi:hypothetical protein
MRINTKPEFVIDRTQSKVKFPWWAISFIAGMVYGLWVGGLGYGH